MIVSDQAKVLFLHIPRTGGTSINNLLLSALPDAKPVLLQHDNAQTAPPAFFRQYADYFKFSFVRNPWERLLSWYSLALSGRRYDGNPPLSFEAFYDRYEEDCVRSGRKRFFFNQLDYLVDKSGEMVVNKVGRYENYEQDLANILTEQNIPFPSIPHINTTAHPHYRSFYSLGLQRWVAKRCQKDIDFFGYRF